MLAGCAPTPGSVRPACAAAWAPEAGVHAMRAAGPAQRRCVRTAHARPCRSRRGALESRKGSSSVRACAHGGQIKWAGRARAGRLRAARGAAQDGLPLPPPLPSPACRSRHRPPRACDDVRLR
jgi:hypothetical protein